MSFQHTDPRERNTQTQPVGRRTNGCLQILKTTHKTHVTMQRTGESTDSPVHPLLKRNRRQLGVVGGTKNLVQLPVPILNFPRCHETSRESSSIQQRQPKVIDLRSDQSRFAIGNHHFMMIVHNSHCDHLRLTEEAESSILLPLSTPLSLPPSYLVELIENTVVNCRSEF